jgi:hypothetical protein
LWDVHVLLEVGHSSGVDHKVYNNLCDSKVGWKASYKYVFNSSLFSH